jgi:hypothetical protein
MKLTGTHSNGGADNDQPAATLSSQRKDELNAAAQSPEGNAALTNLQALVRGTKLRAQLKVDTVKDPETGQSTAITHVRIRPDGKPVTFDDPSKASGMRDANGNEATERHTLHNLHLLDGLGVEQHQDAPGKGPDAIRQKKIDIFTVREQDGYQASVVGGDKSYFASLSPQNYLIPKEQKNFEELVGGLKDGKAKGGTAFLQNASFFNMGGGGHKLYNKQHPDQEEKLDLPDHAPIGEAVIDGNRIPSVPPPDEYKNDFVKAQIGQSSISVGPKLAENGENAFPESNLKLDRFQYGPGRDSPGQLGHADNRNARSMLNVSGHAPGERIYRSVIATTQDDSVAGRQNGLDMADAAKLMTHVNRMDPEGQRGVAFNMDGGGSASVNVLGKGKEPIAHVSQNAADKRSGRTGADSRVVSNFVAFTRPEPEKKAD